MVNVKVSYLRKNGLMQLHQCSKYLALGAHGESAYMASMAVFLFFGSLVAWFIALLNLVEHLPHTTGQVSEIQK